MPLRELFMNETPSKNVEFLMPETEQGIRYSERPTLKTERVDRQELRSCYLLDAICFRAVTIYQNFLPLYTFKYTTDRSFWEDWFIKSNFYHEFVESIANISIYGDSYTELLRKNKKTVGLANICPEHIDYQKDADDQILVDKHKNPLGYTQKLPFSYKKNEIKFKANQIFNQRFFDVGDGYYGIGIIEPIYNVTRWKLNMLQGYAEAVQQVGFPMKVITVGDEKHEPTKEDMTSAFITVKGLNRTNSLAKPYYHQLEIKEPRWALTSINEQIRAMLDQQIAGPGIPKSLLTGLGGDTNRQTLIYQTLNFERDLNAIRKKLAYQTEEILFAKVAEEHGINSYPRFEWKPIGLKDLTDLAKRLQAYDSIGLLTDEDRKTIKEKVFGWEGLPGGEPDAYTGLG